MKKKRGPLTGPYKNASCQWFMADGADCGAFTDKPGTFTGRVCGGSCDPWDFGKSKDGGRPFQSISFIKPYGMRNGNPSNSLSSK